MLRPREEVVSRAYASGEHDNSQHVWSMSVNDIALTSEEDTSLPTHSKGCLAERVVRSVETQQGCPGIASMILRC